MLNIFLLFTQRKPERSVGRPLFKLRRHILCLLALGSMLLEEIGEKEHFQDGKHNEHLYGNDEPQGLAQRHVSESVIIEVERSIKKVRLVHRSIVFAANIDKYL